MLKNGQPHICPIEMYISGTRQTSDTISLNFIFEISLSILLSFFSCSFPATDAPYPPETTAFIISSTLTAVSSKSTCILFCNKFTFTDFTPLSFLTLFSTCALHALHVIPVTLNFSVTLSPSRIF